MDPWRIFCARDKCLSGDEVADEEDDEEEVETTLSLLWACSFSSRRGWSEDKNTGATLPLMLLHVLRLKQFLGMRSILLFVSCWTTVVDDLFKVDEILVAVAATTTSFSMLSDASIVKLSRSVRVQPNKKKKNNKKRRVVRERAYIWGGEEERLKQKHSPIMTSYVPSVWLPTTMPGK